MKHVVFGDVAGHFRPLKRSLKSLGVDVKSLVIPDDTIIVQVGDLVHKGPNSTLVVNLVDGLMRNNPGQWIQLAGNHELPYVTNHRFFYPDRVEEATAEILRYWKRSGLLKAAYAFSRGPEQFLVSHAGVTSPQFIRHGAADAYSIAESLNVSNWDKNRSPGNMFYGRGHNRSADPFWAECVGELYSSWAFGHDGESPVPSFHQIHGHSSPMMWDYGRLRYNYMKWVTENLEVFPHSRHTKISVKGKDFWGIDPGLERHATITEIVPLIIE